MKSKILALGFIFLLGANSAFAALLQIDTPYDGTNTTQTGMVGTTPVTVTTGDTAWHSTFNDESGFYDNTTVWGALAQPTGTVGDNFRVSLVDGEIFDIQIRLDAPLLDPIIYINDIDAIGGSVLFPSGGDTKVVYSGQAPGAGAFLGDTLVHQIDSPAGTTSGTNGAIQYLGLFPTNHIFALTFDFDVNTFAAELVGLTIAGTNVTRTSVPEPATLTLFCFGLAGTTYVARRRLRKRAR